MHLCRGTSAGLSILLPFQREKLWFLHDYSQKFPRIPHQQIVQPCILAATWIIIPYLYYYFSRLNVFTNTLCLKEWCAALGLFPVILIPLSLTLKFPQQNLLSTVQESSFPFETGAYHLLRICDSSVSTPIILCKLQDKGDHYLCFRSLKQ